VKKLSSKIVVRISENGNNTTINISRKCLAAFTDLLLKQFLEGDIEAFSISRER